MLTLELAVFLQFTALRILAFVLHARVVTLLALGAGKSHDVAH